MDDSRRGRFLWKPSNHKPMPRFVIYFFAFVLLGLAAVIGFAMIDVIRPGRHMWTSPGALIGFGMIAFFTLFGAWVLYCAVVFVPSLGVHFFEQGFEIGERKKRKFVRYQDLELLKIVLANAPEPHDKTFQALRAVNSIIAMNPAKLGLALGELAREPVYSELFIKPPGDAIYSFTLSKRDHELLVPSLQSR